MIRDRGRKKWTAMMLPEHVVKLREWVGEDCYEEKPAMDEWTLQEFQQQLDIASQLHFEIRIKIWEKGVYSNATGILVEKEEQAQVIYIMNEGVKQKIPLDAIVGMELLAMD